MAHGSPSRRSGSLTSSRSGGSSSSRHSMKKGPWTANEDTILMDYVRKNGEGNWNAVQRNSGLMRCGKSCRLRWANHLRPNLKKGAFTPDEEALIVELHSKFGNKWARMASQLPGRTDNEIKNYWNTRLKRRQRAGLPIYPLDLPPLNQYQTQNPQPNPSLVSVIAAVQGKPGYGNPLSIFDMFTHSPPVSTSQNQLLRPSNFLSDSSPSIRLFQNKNGASLQAMPSVQFNCLNFRIGNTVPVSDGTSFEQTGTSLAIQSLFPERNTTPTTSSGSDYVIATSCNTDDHDDPDRDDHQAGNSGLLEDLVEEAQAITRSEKPKEACLDPEKSQGGFLWDYNLMEDDGSISEESGALHNVSLDKPYEDSSPAHSSIRPKTRGSSEGSNSVEDDLFSLLDDIPLTVSMPGWYNGNGNEIDGKCTINWTEGKEGKLENHQLEPSNSHVARNPEATGKNRTDGASCWKNLPGIY